MNVRFLGPVFAAAALAAALPGCGGGGGTPAVSTPSPMVSIPLGQAVDNSRPGTAAIAARNNPRAGSVTQSSNTASGSNNTTADLVEVDFDDGTYTISNTRSGAQWEISTTDATPLPEDIAAGADVVGLVKPEDGGHRFVVAQTRSPTAENTDWLTAGIWAFVPTAGDALTSYEFGAFADGGDLFEQDMEDLTGTARYAGRAFGVYYSISSDGNSDAGPFGGAISLTADFGAAGALGTISGSITDVVVEGGERVADAAMTLGEADIGSANGGFFTGDTSMTLGGRAYTGRWGGQFFNNGADGTAPGSVAGTFGASIQDGEQAAALVGAYAADRQAQ